MLSKPKFIKPVFDLKELPKLELPEVILCGRSNVGKSSFINSLFKVPGLAKTSSTPGKTRSLNYYSLGDDLYMVDMPGYGYSKAPRAEIIKYSKLSDDFLALRTERRLVLSLVDSRHKPSESDLALWDYLKQIDMNFAVIHTKTDKINQKRLAEAGREVKSALALLKREAEIYPYSAVTGNGWKEIINRLQSFVEWCKS